jgi:signal transduction histidine kinase/ligand-binding sensor domain-containing protein/AraC-like DNA-binding protein
MCFLFAGAKGQNINYRVQHITTEEGLSQNTVDCILKDSHGFMWFGSWNGLNRFDGYTFRIYKSDNSISGLTSNFIYSLAEDKNGNIWIATRNGLNCLNYSTNKVTRLYSNLSDVNSISGNYIHVVFCDSKGHLWVGTDQNGLDVFDIDTKTNNLKKIKHYKFVSSETDRVNVIEEDSKGNFWIGTGNGLVLIAPSGKQIIFSNEPLSSGSISHNEVLCIFEDLKGTLWVGTLYGLNRFDAARKVFIRYYNNFSDPNSISHSVVNSICEDKNGTLIIGTLGGLDFYHPGLDNFSHFPVNTEIDFSLNNKFINSIYAEDQGNVWVGTDKGGINKYNIYQKQFKFIGHDKYNVNSLSHPTVNSIAEDQTYLWIGTAGGGLNTYNKHTHQFKHYRKLSHIPGSISSDYIAAISIDRNKEIWIGTWGGGLVRFSSPESNSFETYLPSTNPNSIISEFISSLLIETDERILIGTLGGLDMFYPKSGQFKHVATSQNLKNRINEVGCLVKDNTGYYWIGTRNGLYRISAKKIEGVLTDNDVERFVHSEENSESIPGNYVISLYQATDGAIWVGTYGEGVCRISIDQSGILKFETFNQSKGLSNNVVYSILEDNSKRIWFSTDKGLSCYDSQLKGFRNYYLTDGLQGNQFYWTAGYKGLNGILYFGGLNGLNYFCPDSIKPSKRLPQVVITDLKVFNTSVTENGTGVDEGIYQKNIDQTEEIRLSYKENVFSLEFSALEYFLPEKIQYAYKLEGVDKDWVFVPASRRFAGYTNLQGGEYEFYVKCTNSDGEWGQPRKIKIIITPPFWATYWFVLSCIAAIIIGTAYYFQYRTRRLKKRKRELERIVKERTAQIEEQNEAIRLQAEKLARRQELIEGQKSRLEQQNSEISEQRDKLIELNRKVQVANQLRLRFFTNISHEFRTPLTLIMGPIEKMLANWRGDAENFQTLQMVNRNAQRLLHLINHLMEFRKIETGKQTLRISGGNSNDFFENIFVSFAEHAKLRKIQYSFTPLAEPLKDWMDIEKIENIVFNLLSNAFKFTSDEGKVSLSLRYIEMPVKDIAKEVRCLEIKVADTGIGIPQDQLNSIFKRFYRVESTENLKVKGSGIGLSLTRELVKAHHGSISVESEIGKGSIFTVRIPVNPDVYNVSEITEQASGSNANFKIQAEILQSEYVHAIRPDLEIEQDEGNKFKLLVVEDNYDLRSFLISSLQKDYIVYEAENGAQGCQLAVQHVPDLVISDIMMPELDGLEMCTRLKENLQTSHIPIILLTARSSVENWIEGFEIGADDYVPKPFSFDILKARIANLIENRQKLRKLFMREIKVEPTQLASTPTDEQFLRKAFSVVEEHYINPEFGVEEFVDLMAVSRSLLHKKLTALTDQSAGDFITAIRLKKSIQMLKKGEGNISEIAYQTGFNDPKYFSRLFKKHFGVSPSDYVDQEMVK